MKQYILNIKNSIAVLGILMCISLSSCIDDDLNLDPDKMPKEMEGMDYLAVGGFFPRMQMDVIPTSDRDANEYQRAQNLAGDIFSGYMAAIGTWNSSINNSTYYMYYGDWNDVCFNVAYTNVMAPWKQIRDKSDEYNLPTAFSVAQIIKIMSMHRVVDNYGAIPYLGFGTNSKEGVPYDSQESIYKKFFEELDESIEALTLSLIENPEIGPMKKFDMIYKGDFKKWIILANTLKLRLAMRISYVEPDLAKKYAEEAVNNTYGVMTTNDDNAVLKTELGYIVSNPLEICWNSYGDTRMGATMDSYMKGYDDPRLGVYFSQSTRGEYNGVRNGLSISNKNTYLPMSAPNIQKNTPLVWISAAEAFFLRAEGSLRGWNMVGNDGLSNTESLYNKGIETSMNQRGIDATQITAYINNATSKPTNFIDRAGSNSANAIANITIKWDNSSSFEQKLERIITQKWLAIYPEGQEAWSELRRTGYPRIFPVVKNNSSDGIPSTGPVRRIPFPKSEYQTNKTEVEKAVQLLGTGGDTGATKVWWDKK